VPHADVAPWVRAARSSVGKTAAARLRTELQTLQQLTVGLNEDFLCLFTFYEVSNSGVLIPIFIQVFSKPYFLTFYFSCCNFKINMTENSVKHSQGINFSRLTLTAKTAIKDLGRATAASLVS
jgi:hypothetical protein